MDTTPDRDRFTSPVFVMEDVKAAMIDPEGKKVVINGASEDDHSTDKSSELTEAQVNRRVALFVILFLGGIIAAIVFAETEPLYCISTVGAMFLIIGSLAVFTNKITLDSLPMLIVPFVGLCMTGIPILMVYQRNHPDSLGFTIDRTVVIKFILVCMGVLGIFMLVIPFVAHSNKISRCTRVTDAVCIYRTFRIKRSEKANGMNRTYALYSPVWQYEVDGVVYVTRESDYTGEDVPQIGETRQIRYDPNDISYIYRPLFVKRLVPAIIGALMIVMCIFTLAVMK